MGIPVVAALPGVGQRADGSSVDRAVVVSSLPRRAHERAHADAKSHVGLRYSSNLPGIPKGDMFVAVATKSAWHAVGEQIASMITFVNKTYSETGQVKLTSRDLRAEPDRSVQPAVRQARPCDRLMAWLPQGRRLADERTAQRPVNRQPLPASYSDRRDGVTKRPSSGVVRRSST